MEDITAQDDAADALVVMTGARQPDPEIASPSAAQFTEWAAAQGCDVTVIQANDGGGYTVLELVVPDLRRFDVTITEPE